MTVSPASAPTPVFPGQAAAPEGPCDLTGMYLMHHAFRRDLRRFVEATATTSPGERDRWQAMQRWWRHVDSFLEEHHTKEDEILWPALRARVDAGGAAVLDAMEEEHGRIDPLLLTARDGLEALATGTGDAARRRETAEAFTALAGLLDTHLAHEERDAVALVQRHLTAAEWAALEKAGLAAKPPPAALLFMLPWVADGLRPADLAPLLSGSAAAPLRLLMRLGRGRYERLADRAFAGAR